MLKMPFVIAHRGVPSLVYENTFRSFQVAHGLGCQAVEFDVKLTRDKIPLVFHDEECKRLLGVNALVEDMDFEELCHLQVGLGKGKPWFYKEPILTLDELLIFLKQTKMTFNLELKPNSKDARETAVLVAHALKTHKISLPNLLVSSFDFNCLRIFKNLMPKVSLGLLYEHIEPSWRKDAKEFNPYSINIDKTDAKKPLVSSIVKAGYKVLVYTVDDKKEGEKLKKMGVTSIFTNCSQKFLSYT